MFVIAYFRIWRPLSILAIGFLAWAVVSHPDIAMAQTSLISEGRCAVVVASRQSVADVRSYIKRNITDPSRVEVFRSQNGWYAITIGTLATEIQADWLAREKSAGRVPADSYCSMGTRFVSAVAWRGTTRAPDAPTVQPTVPGLPENTREPAMRAETDDRPEVHRKAILDSENPPAAMAFDAGPGQLGLTCQPVRRVASNSGAGLSRVMPLRDGVALVWEDLDRPLGQGSISQRAYQIAVDRGGEWQIMEQAGGHAGGSVTERDVTVNVVQYHRMPDGTAVFPIHLDRPSQRFAGNNSTIDIGFLDAATGALRQEDVFGDARFTVLLAAQTLENGDLIIIYKRQVMGHGRSVSGEGPAIFERTRYSQGGNWSAERPLLPQDYPFGTVAPRAAIASDGRRIVVWENREQTWDDAAQGTGSGMTTIYVDSIVYDPANDTWSEIVTVDNYHNIAPHSPSVLVTPDGRTLVWWIRRGPREVRIQEIARDGQILRDPVVLAEGTDINLPHGGHVVGLPQAVADADGNITIAFQRAAGGAASRLKYLRYDSASQSWSGPARLFPDDTRRMQIANLLTTSRGDPIIGMTMPGTASGADQGGGFVLGLSRFDVTRGEWTVPVKLEASGDSHSEPLEVALTMAPDNRLFASWNRRGNVAVQRELFTVTCLPD